MYHLPPQKPVASGAVIGVAVCAIDLRSLAGEAQVPTDIPLTPAGVFRARDGRPEGLPGWYINADVAQRVIAWADAQADDFVIDYEHQTLYTRENGQPAPAAGWFKQLEWREGSGLWALGVRWTDKARAAIASDEFRYISPVIAYDPKTGQVLGIIMAALVNYAAIDGLADLGALAAAKFSFTPHLQPEDTNVKREQLTALLGLAADATDEQIEQALVALKAKAATADDLTTQVAALKAASPDAKPDPNKWVPRAVHDETVAALAALKSTGEQADLDRLIDEGLEDGRIAGKATADWLRSQGLAALKAHLKDSPAIAALKGTQTNGKGPEGAGKEDELTEAELAVCKAMNLTPEEFKASKASA